MRTLCALLTFLLATLLAPDRSPAEEPQAAASAAGYLESVLNRYHKTFDVYTDADAAGNHFTTKGRIGLAQAVPPMKECSFGDRHAGLNAIECQFLGSIKDGDFWGGWYFLNGVLQGDDAAPKENWGTTCNAGLDLRGATELSFWVKGAKGGEVVEFFCLGVGHTPEDPPCPDSSGKVGHLPVQLTTDWRLIQIDLRKRNLGYVLGGFGWTATARDNAHQDITFYLDDIRYNKSRLSEPRFMVSYRAAYPCRSFDISSRNAAYTYDNAVALLAFLALQTEQGDAMAKLLADALVYAFRNDRFYRDTDFRSATSRRLRNAYQGGDLKLWPGWTPNGYAKTARMPGFSLPGCYPDCGSWNEDEFHVSTHTGNVAWAMLALLGYYERKGGDTYLSTAKSLGDWVDWHCRSTVGPGGYTAGYQGREKPSLPAKLTYKATEHNIDLYAAFQRLANLAPGPAEKRKWRNRADHARRFVEKMWTCNSETQECHFRTGTKSDGITPETNPKQVPVDIQAWVNLAFPGETQYRAALEYADKHHRTGCGYDFNDYDRDGVWYEGTAHMALAHGVAGNTVMRQELLECLHGAQGTDGGLPAASKDHLTTGFPLPGSREAWHYFKRAHVGATAWLVLVENNFNPFWP